LIGGCADSKSRVPLPRVLVRSLSVALALAFGLATFVLGTGSAHAADFTYLSQWGSAGSGNGQFHFPNDVSVDTSGGVYVTVRDDNDPVTGDRLEKFDSAGTWLWTQTGFNDPECMAVRGGVLYVADGNNNRVRTLDASSGAVLNNSWATGYALSYASGIAFDAAGNCYVGSYSTNRIVKYSSAGVAITNWACTGAAGVAVDASGNVIAVDYSGGHLNKYTNTGTVIWSKGSVGAAAGQFNTPWGLGLDGLGNIYVADSGNNRIQKFDANGNFISQWGAPQGASFNFPGSVDIDETNALLYVADCNNNRIQKFQLPALAVSPGVAAGRPAAKVFRSASATSVVDEVAMAALGNTLTVNSITVRGLDASSTLRSDVASITLFRDNGNGTYGAGDTLVSSTATFSADASGTAVTFSAVNSAITTNAPAAFWIVYKIGSSPGDRHEVGSRLLPAEVTVASATVLPSLPITSANTGKTIGIDLVPPSTTAAGVPAGWSNSATVTLNATDTYSGVASTRYAINGGASQLYAGPVSISMDGTVTLTYWSTDQASNTEATKTATLLLDGTAPSSPASVTPSNVSTYSVDLSWTLGTDACSGIAYYGVYNHSGGSLIGTTTALTCTASSLTSATTYTFDVFAFDRAGNRSAAPAQCTTTTLYPDVGLTLTINPLTLDLPASDPGADATGSIGVSVGGTRAVSYELYCSATDFAAVDPPTNPSIPIDRMSMGVDGFVINGPWTLSNTDRLIDASVGVMGPWTHGYGMNFDANIPWTDDSGSYATHVTYTLVWN
jgi:sugar lactone lactonase YvrE